MKPSQSSPKEQNNAEPWKPFADEWEPIEAKSWEITPEEIAQALAPWEPLPPDEWEPLPPSAWEPIADEWEPLPLGEWEPLEPQRGASAEESREEAASSPP